MTPLRYGPARQPRRLDHDRLFRDSSGHVAHIDVAFADEADSEFLASAIVAAFAILPEKQRLCVRGRAAISSTSNSSRSL
jgi:hypothetical protein